MKIRFACIVEIPQSHTAHQARDHKYYKRANLKSEPMHDFEIRDIMNRKKHASLSPVFRWDFPEPSNEQVRSLYISLTNESNVCAMLHKLEVFIPKRVVILRPSVPTELFKSAAGHLPIDYDIEIPVYKLMFRSNIPIFPFDTYSVSNALDVRLHYTLTHHEIISRENDNGPYVFWRLYADNAPPKHGAIALSGIERTVG